MLGIVTTVAAARSALNQIADAEIADVGAHYWSPGAYPVLSGTHAGKVFMPFSPEMLAVNLRRGKTLEQIPSMAAIFTSVGGRAARVDLNPANLTA